MKTIHGFTTFLQQIKVVFSLSFPTLSQAPWHYDSVGVCHRSPSLPHAPASAPAWHLMGCAVCPSTLASMASFQHSFSGPPPARHVYRSPWLPGLRLPRSNSSPLSPARCSPPGPVQITPDPFPALTVLVWMPPPRPSHTSHPELCPTVHAPVLGSPCS